MSRSSSIATVITTSIALLLVTAAPSQATVRQYMVQWPDGTIEIETAKLKIKYQGRLYSQRQYGDLFERGLARNVAYLPATASKGYFMAFDTPRQLKAWALNPKRRQYLARFRPTGARNVKKLHACVAFSSSTVSAKFYTGIQCQGSAFNSVLYGTGNFTGSWNDNMESVWLRASFSPTGGCNQSRSTGYLREHANGAGNVMVFWDNIHTPTKYYWELMPAHRNRASSYQVVC